MLDSCLKSTEDCTEENADPKDINVPEPRSSDGECNNFKNKKSSRKTKKEIPLKSTPESSPIKEEEP